ncbi:hypothetical protein D9756_001694 [Leucocoprinus leucothites]|uniref:Fe2OG dioxygenase domain-containing protein n=1 Tax=Leucocoprinus leucothites TaxID=201217 RepID=A0A8H5G536_9AGAR|nr:hypothetical protein D9756_001694 [Leucoagaricus leucothites]
MDHDNETLIALVSSLLYRVVDHETILEALVLSHGDVQRAADILNTSDGGIRKEGKKRKKTNLDGWLKKPRTSTPMEKQIDLTRDDENPSASGHTIKPKSSNAKSPSKPTVDLMTVLRPPPSEDKSKRKVKSLPPLMLSNPSMIAEHTPCTMHLSILPPELACQLFYTMIEASKEWQRNKWWLFDRIVESPHRTSFYARLEEGDGLADERDSAEWQEAARFWYNGRMTDSPKAFPPEMEQACKIIEKVVNEELRKRKRYSLEYGGNQDSGSGTINPVWKANVAASNCYEGAKESVGFHSDQLTYLGPYPTIASLSLGTTRVFRLREVIPTDEIDSRQARTFNIPLPHNSVRKTSVIPLRKTEPHAGPLTIMHASCQEKFKHAVPPQSAIDIFRPTFMSSSRAAANTEAVSSVSQEASISGETTAAAAYSPSNCRINITFRFYRPDFRPHSIPKCDCGVPTILRPDMKNRTDGRTDRYWWACYAGAQNDGKGCKFWKVMDMDKEGRGPCVGDYGSPRSP